MPAPAHSTDTAQPVAPERIGKFTVIREVGRGTTGVVYLAHDAYNDRDVAIKVYHADTHADPEAAGLARRMFLSEAHLVGMLQHPYILPIYDAGEEDGRCYVVTEHVHGARTLADYCRGGSLLRVNTAVEVIFKCAKALHYAHASGVIHRDIKPSNILFTQQGDVRIIDFGIALVADSQVARIEGIAGSPLYMSPEQAQGLPLTNRSDLHSLGAVMYELLTGARPFRGANLEKLMRQIMYATPPPIHTLRQGVPEELENVVATALQKDPARRFKSGLDFAAELMRVHQRLREEGLALERREQLTVLRQLRFFHEFSQEQIAEVLGASSWQTYAPGEEIVKEGELDERFYILVTGRCSVERQGGVVGTLEGGDCFGETSYVRGARRRATIRAAASSAVLKVASTLLEQVSPDCQLRFNRMFLRTLIGRLHSIEGAGVAGI